jgi:hypothetical protein
MDIVACTDKWFVAFCGVVLNMILADMIKSCMRPSGIQSLFISQEENHGSIAGSPNILFPALFSNIRARQDGKE